MDASHRITITICGDGGCGKSSITLRLVRSQWTHEYDPTIEDSYTLSRQIDGQTYHLSLTDTAGQEEYRGMWAASNLRSDAFLLVYDITNESSLQELEYFNDLIDMEAETREDASRANGEYGFVKPIKIVAGNKCDLQESRQVSSKTGLQWARKRDCGFMETSARNVVNIEETFALIVRRVVEARRFAANPGGAGSLRIDTRRGGSTGGGSELGTRRAPTAPLSPLPPMSEKEREREEKESRGSKLRRFWARLRCWP
uniref:Ras n=1 Tax=Pezicula rhizophila TaxID=1663501 RepID=A0A9E8DES8_9HELO|nr:Ras [Pezicula rhizophila]